MTRFAKIFALSFVLAALLILPACRTKTKPQPQPEPVKTDTVGEVAPPPTTVEEPTDFVQPAATAEDLPSDIADLNRTAQERGWIRDAFFAFDESTLSQDAQDALSASATWLKAHPQYNLVVEGHCDERGTEQYNLALGDRRANTAKDYMVTLGIDTGRVKTVSYGEERPFDSGHEEAAWAKNRRAHLVIAGK